MGAWDECDSNGERTSIVNSDWHIPVSTRTLKQNTGELWRVITKVPKPEINPDGASWEFPSSRIDPPWSELGISQLAPQCPVRAEHFPVRAAAPPPSELGNSHLAPSCPFRVFDPSPSPHRPCPSLPSPPTYPTPYPTPLYTPIRYRIDAIICKYALSCAVIFQLCEPCST